MASEVFFGFFGNNNSGKKYLRLLKAKKL